jgi:hypothetical protein
VAKVTTVRAHCTKFSFRYAQADIERA